MRGCGLVGSGELGELGGGGGSGENGGSCESGGSGAGSESGESGMNGEGVGEDGNSFLGINCLLVSSSL